MDFNNLILQNNPLCADCGINMSLYISVNNGITLCKECSLEHQKYFKKSISFILNLNENFIEKDLYLYFQFGGNSSFKTNLFELGYDLTNKNIEKKYKSFASQYYRKILYNMVHGLNDDIEIFSKEQKNHSQDLISENENNDNIEKIYPEFIPYILGKHLKNKNIIQKAKNYSLNTSKKLIEQQNIAWKVTKKQFLNMKNWFFKKKKKDEKKKEK
jgi:hypothetical protein